ncbi:MAG: hypothetical protein Tsb0010_16180 [Parvularculaceae bacterium]
MSTRTLFLKAFLAAAVLAVCAAAPDGGRAVAQDTDEAGAQAADDAPVLAAYRAVYDMTREGAPWAQAVVTLTPIRYQGAEAYRHAIALRFESENVFDETIFDAGSFKMLGKLINTGFGEDLAWNFYAVAGNRLRGAQVFADGREPVMLGMPVPAEAIGGANFKFAASGLFEGKTMTSTAADVGVVMTTRMTALGRETITLADGAEVAAWRVSSTSAAQGEPAANSEGLSSTVWLTERPPYYLGLDAPAQGIAWRLRSVTIFDDLDN